MLTMTLQALWAGSLFVPSHTETDGRGFRLPGGCAAPHDQLLTPQDFCVESDWQRTDALCVCRPEPKRHLQTRKRFTLCVVENDFFFLNISMCFTENHPTWLMYSDLLRLPLVEESMSSAFFIKRMAAATQWSLKILCPRLNLSCFMCIKMYYTIQLLRSSTLISRGDTAGIRFSKDATCREC